MLFFKLRENENWSVHDQSTANVLSQTNIATRCLVMWADMCTVLHLWSCCSAVMVNVSLSSALSRRVNVVAAAQMSFAFLKTCARKIFSNNWYALCPDSNPPIATGCLQLQKLISLHNYTRRRGQQLDGKSSGTHRLKKLRSSLRYVGRMLSWTHCCALHVVRIEIGKAYLFAELSTAYHSSCLLSAAAEMWKDCCAHISVQIVITKPCPLCCMTSSFFVFLI